MVDAVSVRVRAAYDEIAEQYARRNAVMPPSYLVAADEFQQLAVGPVLDLGCGPGRDLAFWTERGVPTVGVDLSTGMLRLAAQRTSGPLVQADMRALPFRPNSFGGVWCSASLLHLPKAMAPMALAEMSRVLRPGGPLVLALQEGDGEQWEHRNNETVDRLFARYSPVEVAALLTTAGFAPRSQERHTSPTGQRWLLHVATLAPRR